MRESGSEGGRMECAPWHEAQFGATERPDFSRALPWMLSLKLEGEPVFAASAASRTIPVFPWQARQVAGRTKWFVRLLGSFDGRMSWDPWQLAHVTVGLPA